MVGPTGMVPAGPTAGRPTAGRPAGVAVHATAVAIGDRGLLIRGASGAGKSALALALVAASTAARAIELVGDDRVLLRRDDGTAAITAGPHPRIAGFVERRGLGLVATPWRERVRLAGCVAVGPVAPAGEAEPWLRDLPTLTLRPPGRGSFDAAARGVLEWWDRLRDAADRTQVA